MAPEMIQKKGHTYTFDYYGLGVLLYEFVAGIPPFYSQNKTQLIETALKKDIKFPPNRFSKNLQDLITQLMIKDPLKRLGAKRGIAEIRNHPWCQNIDFEKIRQFRFDPPIMPSLNKLNFNKDDIDREYEQIESLINECKIYDDKIFNNLYNNNLFSNNVYNNFQINNYQQVNSFNDFNCLSPPPYKNFQLNIGEDSPQEDTDQKDYQNNNFNQSFTYEQQSNSQNNSNLNQNNYSISINPHHFNVDSQNNSFVVNGSRRHFADDFLDFSFYGYSSNETKHTEEEETSNNIKDITKEGSKEQDEEYNVVFFNNNQNNLNSGSNVGSAPLYQNSILTQNAGGYYSSLNSKISLNQQLEMNNIDIFSSQQQFNQYNTRNSNQMKKLFDEQSLQAQICNTDAINNNTIEKQRSPLKNGYQNMYCSNQDNFITLSANPLHPSNLKNTLFQENNQSSPTKSIERYYNKTVQQKTNNDESFDKKIKQQNTDSTPLISNKNSFESFSRQNSSQRQFRESFGPKTVLSRIETNNSLDSFNRLKQFHLKNQQIDADLPLDLDDNGDDISIVQECKNIGPMINNSRLIPSSIKKNLIF